MDVIERIQAFNTGREAERLQLKYQKMRSSPFAFFRGTCIWKTLAATKVTTAWPTLT